MAELYKLIPEILPSDTQKWTAKLVVIEKTTTRTSESKKRFQNLLLVDLQGNEVHATIYDNNISAFQDQLTVGRTYLVSNATVRYTQQAFRRSFGDVQWTITGRTRVQELAEENTAILISKYQFTPFDRFEEFMDTNTDIDIIAVVIDIKPKRFIRTKSGTECFVQDLVLVNQSFETVLMTMWDTFVDKECVYIESKISRKPIIIGKHVRVSSFQGLSLSSKANSCFIFDGPFDEYNFMKTWVEENSHKLNEITGKHSYTTISPSKSSIPNNENITCIKDIEALLKTQTFFWVKSTALVQTRTEALWYMSCQNCNKVSNADYGEIYFCIYCRSYKARAIPRARATVEFGDPTGKIVANVIGKLAEHFLQYSAERLMKCSETDDLEGIRMSIDEEYMFYIKAVPNAPQSNDYSFELMLMMEINPDIVKEKEKETDKGKNIEDTTLAPSHPLGPLKSPIQVKRELFQLSSKNCSPQGTDDTSDEFVETENASFDDSTKKGNDSSDEHNAYAEIGGSSTCTSSKLP